jgi:6-phospho-3-hexuloisomerase
VAVPATSALSALLAVRDEVSGVLSAVSGDQMSGAAALFSDRGRRWFCSGRGRSGLVAQMVAMRLMHVGFDAHGVGDATAPSLGEGDGLVMISGSGETPVTVHFARLARGFGARMLVVTTRADSTLAGLADAVIDVPTAGTGQFGGTLFEQSALLLLDAVVLDLTAGDPQAYAAMQARHANLQLGQARAERAGGRSRRVSISATDAAVPVKSTTAMPRALAGSRFASVSSEKTHDAAGTPMVAAASR